MNSSPITTKNEPKGKVVFVSGHYLKSDRKAGFHWLFEEFSRRGYDCLFFTSSFSLFSYLKSDFRLRFSIFAERNKVTALNDKQFSFPWFTLWHPVNLKYRWLNNLFAPLFRKYGLFPLGESQKWFESACLIVFESTSALMLAPNIKRLNPKAKLIYRVSDDFRVLGSSQVLIDQEKSLASLMDLVSLPHERMHANFEGLKQVQTHPHGVDKALYDQVYQNPYSRFKFEKNLVFIGNCRLDYAFLEAASEQFSTFGFHVLGISQSDRMVKNNVKFYGMLPFNEMVAYVKHADVGLHTLDLSPGIEVFSNSLKVHQYTYCQLPIISPGYLDLKREHVFYYDIKNPETIYTSLTSAARYNRSLIKKDSVQGWDYLVNIFESYLI